MNPRRCGFGVPLEQFDPQTRQAIEYFKRYLEGKVALAADGLTCVELDDPRAVHVARPREGR
jgi:hypothetical protein